MIHEKLEGMELEKEFDEDKNELDNTMLRKIHSQLSTHEVKDYKTSPNKIIDALKQEEISLNLFSIIKTEIMPELKQMSLC